MKSHLSKALTSRWSGRSFGTSFSSLPSSIPTPRCSMIVFTCKIYRYSWGGGECRVISFPFKGVKIHPTHLRSFIGLKFHLHWVGFRVWEYRSNTHGKQGRFVKLHKDFRNVASLERCLCFSWNPKDISLETKVSGICYPLLKGILVYIYIDEVSRINS